MSESYANPLPVPSPLGGERVRVRGARRTRTPAARNFARHLRERSTDAEQSLWRLLRDRRFADFKFRRQYACGIYFLDFFCVPAHLAVELDGGGHGFPDQRARDEVRNCFLVAQGIKVLRFWNHQVRGELASLRLEIWHALMLRTGRTREIEHLLPRLNTPHFESGTPHPIPLPSKGRGGRNARRNGALVLDPARSSPLEGEGQERHDNVHS